jgi:glyoxylase-like metal-dependent hydrolase (beta-lactamase superfamily II)
MPGFTRLAPDLHVWTDTCNVYVLSDGDAAVLVDLGDGSVLERLGDIGVRTVEWVLLTHHHREQVQGAARLAEWRKRGTQVAAPAGERAFLERPTDFRKMRPTLGDPFTVYGASYVRPPVEPLAVDRAFAKMDDFAWRGREFWCIETPGHSPGHMSYLLRRDGERWLAFTGGLMLDGARLHTWFDSEWDYGFAKGIFELGKSAAQVAGYRPELLLPSHGPPVREPTRQLGEYVAKLKRLAELYVRGYDIQRFDNCDQDIVSRPSPVPHLWRLTPHLYKFRGPNYWVNFAMILSDAGRALLIDCGLFDRAFLDTAISRMRERLGLKGIDAIFVTHMHGDHALDAEHVRQKYGAKLWTMEGVADKFERPWDHDLAALLPAYNDRGRAAPGPLKFDRVVPPGSVIHWEGFELAVDWMPGQTPYHACLHGRIDGKTVAFTGDNIFASATDPRQGGNEAVVARNGGPLEDGYLYAAEFLHGIEPDLIVGGHCWAVAEPRELIARYRRRAEELRDAFRALSPEPEYRWMFDPYWVRALPYRVAAKPGTSAEFRLMLRNFEDRDLEFSVTFRCPAGLSVEPPSVTRKVAAESTAAVPVTLKVSADAAPGLRIVSMDITRAGRRHGELFDFIAFVGDPPPRRPGRGSGEGTGRLLRFTNASRSSDVSSREERDGGACNSQP